MKNGTCTYIEGYGTGAAVCFHAEVSGRKVGVVVPQDKIKRMAEILKHTNHVGHMTWHLNNPEAAIPCSTCAHEWKAEDAA